MTGIIQISWAQFAETQMVNQKFSFWEWFYAAMKLVRDHLSEAWTENRIVGFISKSQTEEILRNCRPGTFLLRFADSVIGKKALLDGH